jgi:GT2 family glycosyltransferase
MITLIMPYYDNGEMLRVHLAAWHDWPADIRERFKVIIVDDGSPNAPAASVPLPANLIDVSIYRVTEDRPWHQHAARNLGAHVAADGWLLLTDMDHVLTAENAAALVRRLHKMDEGTVYTLHRIEADTGEPTLGRTGKPKPHPNSFVLTKELYWRIGGYDEEYVGYGTDGKFKERAFHVGQRGHLKRVALTRYWRGLVPDASTTTLGRKESEWHCDTKAIDRKKWQEGREDEILTLDFPWERVL